MKADNKFQFIKMSVPLLDVVKEDTNLSKKKDSVLWRGACPFCSDPKEFTVCEEKGVYYCFSCHIGGDVNCYIAKLHNFTLNQAGDYLLKKYDLALPKELEI